MLTCRIVRTDKQVEQTMRQTAAQGSYAGSAAVRSRHGSSLASLHTDHRPGFTLIEVVVGIGILSVVILAVFMLVTVSAVSFKNSEMRDTATNIANYCVEYIRARNVTLDNPLGHPVSGNFPGLVDVWDSSSNPRPLKPSKSVSDSINIHPVTPSQNYNTTAFYSSLQGYVSIGGTSATGNEDPNATYDSSTGIGVYYDKTTTAPYVVQFPFSAADSRAIKNFAALSGYNAKIYTSNTNKTTTNSSEYDLHYTGTKTNTMAYTGFRVLTQIVARKAQASDPDHVQYYDVQVTVFWIVGSAEHTYSLATQIATYGAS
jgi:prepilin-type N-terminal cleavage/methylation domain-containing protein